MNHVVGSLSLALVLLLSGTASAASLVVDGDGQLQGARDVLVSGVLYEVQFRDDSFANIFGDASGLDANSRADGVLFGQALLDQVLIDSGAGLFDTDPELTNGCTNFNDCRVFIPFAVDALVSSVVVINKRPSATDEISPNDGSTQVDNNLGDESFWVYADFTLQQATPAVPSIGPNGLLVLATLAMSASALAIYRQRS